MTTLTVDELVSQIRDLAPQLPYAGMTTRGAKWHQEWSRVCAAMDALGDVEYAISAYWKTDDIGYLHIYGLLQSLVIAQDAVNLLREHLTNKSRISWQRSVEYADVYRIRTIRNEAIGHPTASRIYENGCKTNRQAGVGIVRTSMRKTGFTYVLHDQRQATPFEVNIAQLVRDQAAGMTQILGEVVSIMEDRVKAHQAKFRSDPLGLVWDKFDEKCFKSFDGSAIQELKLVLGLLDNGIEERCGDLETNMLFIGIKWYRHNLGEELGRAEALRALSKSSSCASSELRNMWRGLGNEIGALDRSFIAE